jgi:hypothetical protein
MLLRPQASRCTTKSQSAPCSTGLSRISRSALAVRGACGKCRQRGLKPPPKPSARRRLLLGDLVFESCVSGTKKIQHYIAAALRNVACRLSLILLVGRGCSRQNAAVREVMRNGSCAGESLTNFRHRGSGRHILAVWHAAALTIGVASQFPQHIIFVCSFLTRVFANSDVPPCSGQNTSIVGKRGSPVMQSQR